MANVTPTNYISLEREFNSEQNSFQIFEKHFDPQPMSKFRKKTPQWLKNGCLK